MASKKEKFKKLKFFLLLFIAMISMIFFSSFVNIKFIYFAPFIIFLFYRFNFITILWISTLLGFFQDLFSSSFFGISAISYLICSIILFREKRFFNDKPINLSIFTIIYSVIYSLFNPILFFIFDKKINLSIKWVATDLLIFPLLDGIYALILFAMPILLIENFTKFGFFKNLWTTLTKKISLKSR